MVYSGGFFAGGEGGVLARFSTAFSNSDASVGLMLGSAFALVFSFVYYMLRRAMSFREMMGCIPDGFKAMVPAIMILTFAWSLKAMTDSLGAKYFVRDLVKSGAEGMQMFLPAIVFLIGCLLAFATGTSWGTFGVLIPHYHGDLPSGRPHGHRVHCRMYGGRRVRRPLFADLRHNDHGLCGRPVRPCQHVSTQLPYAITAAAVSCISYVAAGLLVHFELPGLLALPFGLALMAGFLLWKKKSGTR